MENEKEESMTDEQSVQPSIDGDEPDGGDDGTESKINYSKSVEDIIADIENVDLDEINEANGSSETSNRSREVKFDETAPVRRPMQPNKQHTGLKNISFNVGAAVAPSNKMEFDQEEPESFGVVKLNRPIGRSNNDNTDAMSTISSANSEGMTEQGYFDLKFYHNKLW